MRAGVAARFVLLAAAGGVAWLASPMAAVACTVIAALLYVAVGEGRLLLRYGRPLGLLLAVSAALWTFVAVDLGDPDWSDALSTLWRPASPFSMVLRVAAGSLLAALALGSVPDGRAICLAKGMRLSDDGAVAYAASRSLIAAIRDSFERSVVALRAQGVVGDGRLAVARSLPQVLGLTWTACLDLSMGRASVKWDRARFLAPGAPVFSLRLPSSATHDAAVIGAALALAAVLMGAKPWA